MSIDCCNCCNTRGKATVAPAAAFSALTLPQSILQDLFVWYKMDGLPGETLVTDYSIHGRHANVDERVQTLDYSTESLNPTTWGLKWGPAVGVSEHSSINMPLSRICPSGMPSPNLLSAFFVVNHYGDGNFNFQVFSRIWDAVSIHDTAYRPFSCYIGRNTGGGFMNEFFVSNVRGATSEVAISRSETGSIPYGGANFSADNWRLINYKRLGAGSTNHRMRINRKVQTLTNVAGDYVNASPDPNVATEWVSGVIAGASLRMYVGYICWIMIFVRNLSSAEELLVEDYIYDQMASRGIFLVDLP